MTLFDQIETAASTGFRALPSGIAEYLNRIGDRLTDWSSYPFLVTPAERIHAIYLVSFVAIALAIYLYNHRNADRVEIRNFFKFLFPQSIYTNKSSILDFKYYLINRVFMELVFIAALIQSFMLTGDLLESLLRNIFTSPGQTYEITAFAEICYTLAIVLAADLGFFIGHFIAHKVPLFWEFHKVHHSAEVLNPITNYRFHPVDRVLLGFWIGVLTGVVKGGYGFIFDGGIGESELVNTTILLAFYLPANFRHSHIWLSYGWRLSHILSSPAQHQIHHGTAARHIDKNFGLIFSVWDYLAGTLYVPKEKEELNLGLTKQEHAEYNSVWKLYTLPLVKATRLLFGQAAPERAAGKDNAR